MVGSSGAEQTLGVHLSCCIVSKKTGNGNK